MGTPGASCCLGLPPEKVLGVGGGGPPHTLARTRTLRVRDHPPRPRASHRRVCVRVCVSPRPAVTAPSSRARGLRAPGRCAGCGQAATPRGLPPEKGPGAPGSRAPLPNLPRSAGQSGRERKKGASLRPRGSVLRRRGRGGRGDRGGPAVATPRRVPAARGAPSPAPPAKLFLFGSPHPKSAAREGEAGRPGSRRRRRARRKWCPRERGRAEEMPGPLGPRPRPPPGQPRAPAPLRLWRAQPGAAVVAAAADVARAARRSQQCGAGKTKGFHFASFPFFHLRSRGAARDPRPAGAAPLGALSRARPGFPADPRSPPTPAPQA